MPPAAHRLPTRAITMMKSAARAVADPDLAAVQYPLRAVLNRRVFIAGGSPRRPGREIAIADDIRPSI